MARCTDRHRCFVLGVLVGALVTFLLMLPQEAVLCMKPQFLVQRFEQFVRESDATNATLTVNSSSPLPAGSTTAMNVELHDCDDTTLAAQGLVETALREWGNGSTKRSKSTSSTPPRDCTDLLRHYGLCDPALFRIPEQRLSYTAEKPFMFLHFSKCAGTSLINTLAYMGYMSFSLRLPPALSTATACGNGSAKCCWWRERLHNFSEYGRSVKILQQEPANDQHWIDESLPGNMGYGVDPGFNVTTDFCPSDFAYLTVLRSPIERVHSHMCDIGVDFETWQRPSGQKQFHIRKQLRDNYYVRSLGGMDAWNAPEGGLCKHHLLAAARALAQFDVVMTVATITSDAPAQMGRVGLPGFHWKHSLSRSRQENLQRAKEDPLLRTSGVASCEVPPSGKELHRLVAACAWDAVLYEFSRVLAARRTEAAR